MPSTQTELDVIMKLANYEDHARRYEIMLPNVFTTFDNEADLFCIRKSGLCDEFEVKISRRDFLNDKKKYITFRNLEKSELDFAETNQKVHPNRKEKYIALIDGILPTNYFWYAVTEGVADLADIPEFAGLIIVHPDRLPRVMKHPKLLHRRKMSFEERYAVAKKSTYRFWSLKKSLYSKA